MATVTVRDNENALTFVPSLAFTRYVCVDPGANPVSVKLSCGRV